LVISIPTRPFPGASGRRSADDVSFVLHEKSRNYHWEGAQSLSIKWMPSGEAMYRVGRGRFRVDPTAYLVVNDRQPYSIEIEAPAPVESFCVFFASSMGEDALNCHRMTHGSLLDDPCRHSEPLFYERLYAHDAAVTPLLHSLRSGCRSRTSDPCAIEEQLHQLLEALLSVHHGVQRDVERLPAVRAATRQELYRRLCQARDYMDACLAEPLSLGDVAGVALLSPHHFLRLFKELYGTTPYQYLLQRRVERARRLLLETDRSVTEISAAVGFCSLGHFSSTFRQRYGSSPAQVRREPRF
jgi:AraC family transcriptional regulator